MHNRRAYPRYSLEHDALIVAKGFSPASCRVINLCAGGMCLGDIDSIKLNRHLAEHPETPVEVHLFDQDQQHFVAMSRVCRVKPSSIGLQFEQMQPQLVESILQKKSAGPNSQVVYTTRSKRNKLRTWYAEAAQRFIQSLWLMLKEHTLASANIQIADSVNLHRTSELKLLRGILLDANDPLELEREFLKAWQSILHSLETDNPKTRQALAELKVVEKGQFEDWLELQMIVTGIAKESRSQLFRLEQFLTQIYGQDIDDRSNPLSPVTMGQALHQALTQAQIGETIRPLFYQAFEQVLNDSYRERMDELIGVFESHGLHALPLESIRTNWSEYTPDGKAVREGGDSVGDTDESTRTERGPDSQPGRKLGNVLQLVKLHRNVGKAEFQPEFLTEGDSTTAEELAGMVQAHQSELLSMLAAPDQTLSTVLRSSNMFKGDSQPSISQDDWDIVELVDKIFAPIHKHKVPDELQGVINQLRLPLVNLLLKDQSFLEESQHPARKVLNHFMALVSADRVSSKNLEKLLKQVVMELSEAGEISPELLGTVADRLEELVKRQESAFNRNADRIAKTYEGKQKLKDARKSIARKINTLIAGQQVPQVLLELLDAGWEHAMVLAFLKEGGDSETVSDYFAALEHIFHWLDPACEDDGLSFERELESAALLDMVEKELAMSPEAGKARSVIKELRHIFIDEVEPKFIHVSTYPLVPYEDEVPEISDTSDIDERWQERAHQLRVGEWMEVRLPDGTIERMRLVWVGENAFKFVFLTPHGLHEIHYNYSELLDGFQSGNIMRVEEGDVPFVDNSLYGIVEDLYQKMAFQAVHDPLTGSMTRHEVEKQLSVVIGRVKQYGHTAALLIMDVDRFDLVNSTYGNSVGDRLLRDMGILVDQWLEPLQAELKLGRTGSNEFALLIDPCGRESALDIANQICQKFAAHKFLADDQSYSATLSVGVVVIDDSSENAGAVLNAGSRSCKEAKRSGGNQSRLYSSIDEGVIRTKEIMQWVARIDNNIEDCNLFLRAQKIQSMDSALPFYEILLGIKDEAGQPISPEPFIVASEKYKKSAIVDTWVVSQVMDWMRANPESLSGFAGFTVNLSGHSLSDNQFLEFLEQQFQRGGFPASKICFEVTETAAVLNINYTADFMREIKRNGCFFALDDFGTGFSSYAYLQKLPVDFLKIDGVFVRDISENMTNYAMVKSISELSRFLGVSTIAECVEDQLALDALSEIGVEYVQGFHVEKPLLLLDL